MKKLYLIDGTMGVGKTTTSQILKNNLADSVFLDGDWCWDSHPFKVTSETKKMVMDNIVYMLNSFIHCSAYQHIIFCWVMHEQSIIDEICCRLDLDEVELISISLVCSETALRQRLQRDVDQGKRQQDVIDRSVARVMMYQQLNTVKIDVSHKSPEDAAKAIILL